MGLNKRSRGFPQIDVLISLTTDCYVHPHLATSHMCLLHSSCALGM